MNVGLSGISQIYCCGYNIKEAYVGSTLVFSALPNPIYELPSTTFTGASGQQISSGYRLLQPDADASAVNLKNWTLLINITENNCTSGSVWLYEDGGYHTTTGSQKYCNVQGGNYTAKCYINDGYTSYLRGITGKVAIRRKLGNTYVQYTTDGKTWNDMTTLPIDKFIDRANRTLTFGGRGDQSGYEGKGTISAKLWNKSFDDISDCFDDKDISETPIYTLPETTFTGVSGQKINTGYSLLQPESSSSSENLSEWTLFYNVTQNNCTFDGNTFLFEDGGYVSKVGTYCNIECGYCCKTRSLLSDDYTSILPVSDSGVGKVAIRRKEGYDYIQYSFDGKTWNDIPSFKISKLTTRTAKMLTFGGNAAGSGLGKGTISANLWNASLDDISTLF